MTKTFDQKIKELEHLKSESNIDFLQTKKQKYESELAILLKDPISEWDESNAIKKFNEARECLQKITDINDKIDRINQNWNNNQELENIDKKISFYKGRKKSIKELPLYRDTQEWIAEIFWNDELYQYAKETDNKKLIELLENRKLTESDYRKQIWYMYKDLFKVSKKISKAPEVPKKKVSLPEWMSKTIKKELNDIEWISAQELEDFLIKELKKNSWEIRISHIKNRFEKNASIVKNIIKKLISEFPTFKIIDNTEPDRKKWHYTPTKNEKLISSISDEETQENKKERLRINNLQFKLNEIWKLTELKSRVSKYLDLFEELNINFANRDEFEPRMYEIIATYTHINLEKEIIKTLNWLILWNYHSEKTWLYRYNVYRFNRDSRRMLAYPNWEIFAICPHEEYEKIIESQPPINKIE